MADPGRVGGVLTAAGFHHLDIDAHNDVVVTTEDRIPGIAQARTRIGLVAELLRDADHATRSQVLSANEYAMRLHLQGHELRLTRGTLLVVGEA